jgi:hypothetical protein
MEWGFGRCSVLVTDPQAVPQLIGQGRHDIPKALKRYRQYNLVKAKMSLTQSFLHPYLPLFPLLSRCIPAAVFSSLPFISIMHDISI